MCVYSMVMDHFGPKIPEFTPLPGVAIPFKIDPADLAKFEQLVKEFREAADAAKLVDVLTKQPDCEDPEKAKLVERVDRLEAEVKRMRALLRRRK